MAATHKLLSKRIAVLAAVLFPVSQP